MAVCIFIVVYISLSIRANNRKNNAIYVKGLSLGVNQGVKGSYYLDYQFEVNNELYKGTTKKSFCDQCPTCCIKGDSVIVQYENNNPQNNDLVVKLPIGSSLQR